MSHVKGCSLIAKCRIIVQWVTTVVALLLPFHALALPAPDSHIIFDAPKPGQVFAPGDKINVILRIQPPLKEKTTDAILGIVGMGEKQAAKDAFRDRIFHWSVPIPQWYAGPLTFNPMVVAGEDPAHPGQPLMVMGAPLTVAVVPKETPLSLGMPNHDYYLDWPASRAKKEQLYVKGLYAKGERDLTSSAGTLWRSSEPAIAAVDEEGHVTVTGPGIVVITAENHGIKTFANFVIEDPTHPLPSQNITPQVKIRKSDLRNDPEAKAYRKFPLVAQTVTITNNSGLPIPGPLYLTVSGLSKDIWLWQGLRNPPKNPPPNMILFQRVHPQAGKPLAIRLDLNDGLNLNPGESAVAKLYFLINKPGSRPEYTLAVLRSSRM